MSLKKTIKDILVSTSLLLSPCVVRQERIQSVNLSRYGARGFYISGPKTWNQLPDNVRDTTVTEQQF